MARPRKTGLFPSSVHTHPPIMGILETAFVGVVTAETIGDARKQLEVECTGADVHVWMVNALDVTTFTPDIVPPSVGLVLWLKKKTGCGSIVAAITDAKVTMIARVITASGLMKLHVFPTMEETRKKAMELRDEILIKL
jgi:hypothetical protein